ncbi:MAG: CDP-alcohol phosphatidyltransferase family protein [Endozoicomonas sp. (ex Botrylloides leachii)]|nr:CDP-alcohol phosphatidyltransferase family protein [Endozoicomonas sp. (ex Botrylloides leachii)]
MLDRWTAQWVRTPLNKVAVLLVKRITPNQLTFTGFIVGLTAIPLLASQLYLPALAMIAINRLMDGLDGALARLTTPTDAGGFLDITLDFIFYAGIVLGFALANPIKNGVAANLLLFSFMATGSSFLAYAIMAEKHKLVDPHFSCKSFYYLGGIVEGTETIMIFILFCLVPTQFPTLATGFAAVCLLTALMRVIAGFQAIKYSESRE